VQQQQYGGVVLVGFGMLARSSRQRSSQVVSADWRSPFAPVFVSLFQGKCFAEEDRTTKQ